MILVSGGSGVLGSRLVHHLCRAGHAVRALVLPGDPANARLENTNCEVVAGDVSKAETLAGVFDGVDTVYHLAAVILARDPGIFSRVNVGGTANMVSGARAAGVRHFIYVSSASVTYPRRTPYAESKLQAERMVVEQQAMSYTVARPTLVYDTGGGQEFMLFYDYLERFPLVPFIGSGEYLKRPVWAGDLVQGLAAIVDNPATYGKIYNLSGPQALSIGEMARMMIAHKGKRRWFVHLPLPLCRALAVVMSAVMKEPPLTTSAIAGVTQHADLDCTEAKRDLGYDPILFAEGLRRCFPPRQR